MKHNFSRELAHFNLAQEILEKMTQIGDEIFIGFIVDQNIIDACATKCIGRDLSKDEHRELLEVITSAGPEMMKDCFTFDLAHILYHIVKD